MSGGSGALEACLTDHMAGSVSASDLAKRGAKNNDGPMRSSPAWLPVRLRCATAAPRLPSAVRVCFGM
jgi:hypothetical protein